MKTIIFTGGGTAGHVMPNVALMERLKNLFNCLYVGTDGMEKQIITKNFGEDKFLTIRAEKLRRKLTLKNLALPFLLAKSVKQCKELLKKEKPALVFSKGGYVSLPVVIAAHSLGVPVLAHESDFSPGLANKVAKRYCKQIFTTFEDTAKLLGKKAVFSGSPIRQAVHRADKMRGLETMGFDGKRKIITIVGGSLGAQRLNDAVFASLERLTEKFDVFLIAGKGKTLPARAAGFAQAEFIKNIFDVFAASDVVVSRSGSNTVCELAAMHKPMLLVPLSRATRGEQMQNAKYFAERGCAVIADENTLTPQIFCDKVGHVVDNAHFMKENQKKLKIDGTAFITEAIVRNANDHTNCPKDARPKCSSNRNECE